MLPERVADHLELVRAVWLVVTASEADAVFSLFFEVNGLAASGREPYRTLVPTLVEHWITWSAERIDGTPEERRTEAEAAIALVDGLLLLRLLAGSEPAERAAKRMGVG